MSIHLILPDISIVWFESENALIATAIRRAVLSMASPKPIKQRLAFLRISQISLNSRIQGPMASAPALSSRDTGLDWDSHPRPKKNIDDVSILLEDAVLVSARAMASDRSHRYSDALQFYADLVDRLDDILHILNLQALKMKRDLRAGISVVIDSPAPGEFTAVQAREGIEALQRMYLDRANYILGCAPVPVAAHYTKYRPIMLEYGEYPVVNAACTYPAILKTIFLQSYPFGNSKVAISSSINDRFRFFSLVADSIAGGSFVGDGFYVSAYVWKQPNARLLFKDIIAPGLADLLIILVSLAYHVERNEFDAELEEFVDDFSTKCIILKQLFSKKIGYLSTENLETPTPVNRSLSSRLRQSFDKFGSKANLSIDYIPTLQQFLVKSAYVFPALLRCGYPFRDPSQLRTCISFYEKIITAIVTNDLSVLLLKFDRKLRREWT